MFSWLHIYYANLPILWDLSTLCIVDHLWPLIHEHIYILDWSAVGQSLFGKNRPGAFRRTWKTLFCTVAINQGKLVSVIAFCFSDDTCFMAKINQAVLYYVVNNSFDDYSSSCGNRDTTQQGTYSLQNRSHENWFGEWIVCSQAITYTCFGTANPFIIQMNF